MRRCKYWDILDPIMSDRACNQPPAPTVTLDPTILNLLEKRRSVEDDEGNDYVDQEDEEKRNRIDHHLAESKANCP